MLDISYSHFDLNSKFKTSKNMTLFKIWVSENGKNCLKNFFSVNFARFSVLETLKYIWQTKDKIKCNKSQYIFNQIF